METPKIYTRIFLLPCKENYELNIKYDILRSERSVSRPHRHWHLTLNSLNSKLPPALLSTPKVHLTVRIRIVVRRRLIAIMKSALRHAQECRRQQGRP